MTSHVARRTRTRARLLAASAELMAERGSVAVSLAEIGSHAGYSRGGVNYEFGSKSALLLALATELPAPWDGIGSEHRDLVTWVDDWLAVFTRHPQYWRLWSVLVLEARSGRVPELGVAVAQRHAQFSEVSWRSLTGAQLAASLIAAPAFANLMQVVTYGLSWISEFDPDGAAHAERMLRPLLLELAQPQLVSRQASA